MGADKQRNRIEATRDSWAIGWRMYSLIPSGSDRGRVHRVAQARVPAGVLLHISPRRRHGVWQGRLRVHSPCVFGAKVRERVRKVGFVAPVHVELRLGMWLGKVGAASPAHLGLRLGVGMRTAPHHPSQTTWRAARSAPWPLHIVVHIFLRLVRQRAATHHFPLILRLFARGAGVKTKHGRRLLYTPVGAAAPWGVVCAGDEGACSHRPRCLPMYAS